MKQTIAFDIDEVLADYALALQQHAKKTASITIEDHHFKAPGPYWHYHEQLFSQHGITKEHEQRAIHESLNDDIHNIVPVKGAIDAIRHLSKHYKIVLITARDPKMHEKTELWLKKHFDGLYDELHVLGNFKVIDNPKSKGQACDEVGASWLIDDNPEHCESAASYGVTPILFGDFGWQLDAPNTIQRCKTWQDVLEYFDGQAK